MKAKKIHADFQNTPGDSALSYPTVTKWTSEFKFGRESFDVIRVEDCQKVLLSRESELNYTNENLLWLTIFKPMRILLYKCKSNILCSQNNFEINWKWIAEL